MLRCVARAKSPIARAARMSPVWGLPQGESQPPPEILSLPRRDRPPWLLPATRPAHREEPRAMATELTGVVADHVAAVNAFDTDGIVATFAEDAYVNDNRREIAGIDAIRRWVEKEMVGDKVTIDVREVVEHYGDIIVRAAYDGEYDKTNLPQELILSNYFSIRDGKIVSLAVIFNQPSPY